MSSKKKVALEASGYLSANGLKMYYETAGSGPPLILVHGGLCTTTMWRGAVPKLAQHFHVIAIDSRSHGRTNNPSGTITYRLMADDVAAFIKATGLVKPFVLWLQRRRPDPA